MLDVVWCGPEAGCRSRGNASTNEVKPELLHGIYLGRYRRSTRTRIENRKFADEHDCIARSGIIKTH